MSSIVKQTKKYKVVKNVSYQHELLGTFVIEAGDILEQCIDDKDYFSNGLALVTEANILCRVPEFFVLDQPEVQIILLEKPKNKLLGKINKILKIK